MTYMDINILSQMYTGTVAYHTIMYTAKHTFHSCI
jgi:hypothetical protein